MIDALLEHLATACPDFAAIEDATRLNPLERDDYPVVTVYLASEAPNLVTVSNRQRSAQTYHLIVTCQSGEQLESARAALKAAMRSFTTTGVLHEPSFNGGELAALSGPLLQWRDSWQIPLDH